MNIQVVEEIKDDYFEDLLELYQQEDWTRSRTPEDINVMLGNCKTIGLVDRERNKLVGFSRIITDYVYRATIFDVIVKKEYQGVGIGRILMDSIMEHPQLKKIERFELYCEEDKVEFYNKWNLSRVTSMTNLMRRINTTV